MGETPAAGMAQYFVPDPGSAAGETAATPACSAAASPKKLRVPKDPHKSTGTVPGGDKQKALTQETLSIEGCIGTLGAAAQPRNPGQWA